jgi:hypothetical protein
MRVVCAVRGMSAYAPLIPLRRTPQPCSKHPKTLAGRAGEQRRVSSKFSESRQHSQNPPLRIEATNFGFQPRRVPPLPLSRHSS